MDIVFGKIIKFAGYKFLALQSQTDCIVQRNFAFDGCYIVGFRDIVFMQTAFQLKRNAYEQYLCEKVEWKIQSGLTPCAKS